MASDAEGVFCCESLYSFFTPTEQLYSPLTDELSKALNNGATIV